MSVSVSMSASVSVWVQQLIRGGGGGVWVVFLKYNNRS